MPTSKTDRDDALARLREWVEPGDELCTILRHVSRSGMSRVIDVIKWGDDECHPGKQRVYGLGYNAAQAAGYSYDRDRNGVKIGGCGMDMGFQLVYTLSSALYPDGFECIGENCPSNDHSNGDRDYSPHHHKDGGYAIRQRWL